MGTPGGAGTVTTQRILVLIRCGSYDLWFKSCLELRYRNNRRAKGAVNHAPSRSRAHRGGVIQLHMQPVRAPDRRVFTEAGKCF